jgi:hypothetical protein
MKKVFIVMLILLPALCSAQVAFQFATTKTFTVDTTDTVATSTIYIYAPPAFGHKLIRVGNQPHNTDTTNSSARPAPYIFTTDTLDFQILKTSGPDSSADSTLIKLNPLDVDFNVISNDSVLITAADTTSDVFSGGVVRGYKVAFKSTKAPYGIKITHIIGGNGGTFKAQYRLVWPVEIYKP